MDSEQQRGQDQLSLKLIFFVKFSEIDNGNRWSIDTAEKFVFAGRKKQKGYSEAEHKRTEINTSEAF